MRTEEQNMGEAWERG